MNKTVEKSTYRVLARKYRPSTFSELVGQDVMVRTLTNAIEIDRLPHAFILIGVRGIGKTSTARIIARALNCVSIDGTGRATAEPCRSALIALLSLKTGTWMSLKWTQPAGPGSTIYVS